jgi:hypothetical protein
MIKDHDRRHLNLASLLALDLSFVRRAADERDGDQQELAALPDAAASDHASASKHRHWLWTMARRWSRRTLSTCRDGAE